MIGVIGGSGFLGSFIFRELRRSGVPSLCLDISPPSADTQFIDFDVTSPSSPDFSTRFDAVINLAAVHRDDIKPLRLLQHLITPTVFSPSMTDSRGSIQAHKME